MSKTQQKNPNGVIKYRDNSSFGQRYVKLACLHTYRDTHPQIVGEARE
jgi:hypothetical protein